MSDPWPVNDPPAGSALYDDVTPTVVLEVIRPVDLLSLAFGLVNLMVQEGQLVRVDPGSPAIIIVGLPPQHVVEAVLPAQSDVGGPAVAAAVAGGSQLAFRVPDAVATLALDLPTLLGWASLVPVASVSPAGEPKSPTGTHSILELPYRMLLAVDDAQWRHPIDAVLDPATGTAELWRTRADAPGLHVTWSQDMDPPFRPPTPDPPARIPGRSSHPATISPPAPPDIVGSLSAGGRRSIGYAAPALDVDSLTMSALGATTSVHAMLPDPSVSGADRIEPKDVEVTDWQHIMSLGRDSYVKVASKGRLAPFGHAVTIVTVTERMPATATVGGVSSSFEGLVQNTRLIVSQPLVDYTDPEATAAYAAKGKTMCVPLSKVHLPDQAIPVAPLASSGLVRTTDGQPLRFQAIAEDLSGAAVQLSLPMVYVQDGDDTALGSLYPPPELGSAAEAAADAMGQSVAFVGVPGQVATAIGLQDGSVLPVDAMLFDLSTESGPLHPFLPKLNTALVQVPTVSALAAGALGGSVAINYHSAYLAVGIDPDVNPGALFAEVQAPPALAMAASAAGGLVAPQFNVEGLSRNLGPVADVQGLLNGGFDPTKLLPDATFLGGIKLSDMLAPIESAVFDGSKVPAFVRQLLPAAGGPQTVQTSFTWSPTLRDTVTPSPPPDGSPRPLDSSILSIDTSQSTLTLTATITAPLDGSSPPTYDTSGQLTSIKFTFLDAVVLSVGLLAFHAASGSKVTLKTGPNLKVCFKGDLAFVDELARSLPADGFGDGTHLDVDDTGVTVGYSVAIPSIGVGIISIQNVAFSAALSLPFDGPLGLRLAFSTREHPFLVSVSFIAGGGYFSLDIDSRGVNEIEGALELGADLSVDLVIVSAEVHALAGFYFTATSTGTSFSGFLRVGGSVDLLGLISVSIELFLQLGYTSDNSQIAGSASLTLSVHLLFVTKSVTLHMEKHFDVPSPSALHAHLASGAVSFGDVISPQAWGAYLEAFA
jgi:hypothetical protein